MPYPLGGNVYAVIRGCDIDVLNSLTIRMSSVNSTDLQRVQDLELSNIRLLEFESSITITIRTNVALTCVLESEIYSHSLFYDDPHLCLSIFAPNAGYGTPERVL